MKLIQPAKFFHSAGGTVTGEPFAQAAHVTHGDLVLMSKLPESAAEAERINEQVKAFIARAPQLGDFLRRG